MTVSTWLQTGRGRKEGGRNERLRKTSEREIEKKYLVSSFACVLTSKPDRGANWCPQISLHFFSLLLGVLSPKSVSWCSLFILACDQNTESLICCFFVCWFHRRPQIKIKVLNFCCCCCCVVLLESWTNASCFFHPFIYMYISLQSALMEIIVFVNNLGGFAETWLRFGWDTSHRYQRYQRFFFFFFFLKTKTLFFSLNSFPGIKH